MSLKSIIIIPILLFCAQFISVNAQETETGSIKIVSTSAEILGADLASQYEKIIDSEEEISWLVYVPESYDPANPPGVLLYQIYGSQLREPNGWKSVMDEKNLILIRLFVRGKLTPQKELLLSILGPTMIQQKYAIDTSRVYTSADIGCRAAGTIAKIYPNIIKGAIYINCIPTTWRKEEPAQVAMMRDNRYVFISGKERSNVIDVRPELRKYREAGIVNTKFYRTSRLKVSQNLTRTYLAKSIDYLDGVDNF